MESNMHNGVRAEPKFLRDPTSLESISTSISRLSSYVTSNLSKRKSNTIPVMSTTSASHTLSIPVSTTNTTVPPTPPPSFDPSSLHHFQYQQQQQQKHYIFNEEGGFPKNNAISATTTNQHTKITFATFEQERLKYQGKTIPCLILGYVDGFQIWNMAHPDNVHEICSVRDPQLFHNVSLVHLIKNGSFQSSSSKEFYDSNDDDDGDDSIDFTNGDEEDEPVLAIVSENASKVGSDQEDENGSSTTTSIPAPPSLSKKTCRVILYGLKSQSIIHEVTDLTTSTNTTAAGAQPTTDNDDDTLKDDTTLVTCIQSNHKVIALGCLSRYHSFIKLLSTKDYKPLASSLTDVYHDVQQGPIFTLGSRLIAYATNAAVLNTDPVMSTAIASIGTTSTASRGRRGTGGNNVYPHHAAASNASSTAPTSSSYLNHPSSSLSFLSSAVAQKYDKDAVKGAAKDIAKEVVSGMKTLSEFGLNTLSNYFNNSNNNPNGSTVAVSSSPNSISYRRASTGMHYVDYPGLASSHAVNTATPPPATNAATTTSQHTSSKKSLPSGMVMIRDIAKLPKQPTRNLSPSVIAHFRPHTHPLSCLCFNPAGTLLTSASKQGHTFHVFSILTPTYLSASSSATAATAQAVIPHPTAGYVTHLYSLNRGITDAQVEDCQFSSDSSWCAISTARGTTHVYAINPYGGKPEILGHVYGKVYNPQPPPLGLMAGSSGISSHNNKMKSSTAATASTTKIRATGLSSVVRIKQRRKMPDGNSTHEDPSTTAATAHLMGYGYYAQQQQQPQQMYMPPPPNTMMMMMGGAPPITAMMDPYGVVASSMAINNMREQPRARLVSMFVHGSRSNTSSNSMYKQTALSSSVGNPLVGSIKQQASNVLSSINSYYTSNSNSNSNNSNNNNKNELMFGFDEEYYDDHQMDQKESQEEDIGFQDVFTFHPAGILTLHRCWVSKTVMKKREHSGYKMDLMVKEEDIAEWNVARGSDWETVAFDPFNHPSTTSTANEEQEEQTPATNEEGTLSTKTSATSSKEKKSALAQQQQQPPVLLPANTASSSDQNAADRTTATKRKSKMFRKRRQRKEVWLSNAEITTYCTQYEPSLWTRHQFSFQPFQQNPSNTNGNSIKELLVAGLIPPTETMQLRKETPEPVSSRLDRIRKTTIGANLSIDSHSGSSNSVHPPAHASSVSVDGASGELIEDALAELQDNLSKAMQTTSFSPSSTTTTRFSQPRGDSPWLSSPPSTNAPLVPTASSGAISFMSGRSPHSLLDTHTKQHSNSSLSFEDAYLIHMGSGPSPEPLPSTTTQLQEQDSSQQLQMSSLIQFDDDDDKDQEVEPLQQQRVEHQNVSSHRSPIAAKVTSASPSSTIIQKNVSADVEEEDEDISSSVGDNEIDHPYESIYGDFNGRGILPAPEATIFVEEDDDDDEVG